MPTNSKEYYDKYYRDNQHQYKTKVRCEICNCEVSKSCISRHRKTNKHMKKLEEGT